ncbi:MAG TPA: helix-turn-helix transcriptional regulator, partial [Candidatus Saccharimonadia bacterium]|nr:helix-turn-helix transcriptional regulator [Candidatus Saccharimonadia bacterium]
RSGKPLINRLEVWYDEQRNLDWFLTTKLPVLDKKGKVIGVMGITRRDEDRMRHHDVREVTAAVQHARKNCDKNVSTAELARAAGVSERHLHRKLRDTLGLTPHELMLRTRIQSPAEALAKTSVSIIEIAISHGFCDQSAFTQQFRKRTGVTPKQFRLRNQG